MANESSVIRQALQAIGMGPARMTSALEGAQLFGTAGLLNSLELVQFITALCEITRIDVEDFVQSGTDGLQSIFGNVGVLGAFLTGRAPAPLSAPLEV